MINNLGFIGGGNMTSSLIHGLIESGYSNQHIFACDPNPDKIERLRTQFSIECFSDDANVAKRSDILILAVKPQMIRSVAEQLTEALKLKQPLIISIAAGINTHHLHTLFGDTLSIVRAMPNTGALLQVGATGLYANSKVSEDQKSLAESILRAVGITVWVNHEHDLDTITALSGSGPAYFFLMMDALQQAGISLGLTPEISKILTLQTAFGAARMALESEINLDQLIARVASKGGTTEKALQILEQKKLRQIFQEAVQAAANRAKELSQEFEQKMT